VTAASAAEKARSLSNQTKRLIGIGSIVVVIIGLALGTKVVPNDEVKAGAQVFDPVIFGTENFPIVQKTIIARSVDAATLASAIAADATAAAQKYATPSSGGPVFSVKLTGVVGEGQSGIYPITVEGLPSGLSVRVQTGPAVNGTELRDATGDISFGQFTNQIEYQNAASALNEQAKAQVLVNIDQATLAGKTVDVTGAFTLINPASWLITPVEFATK